jgi:hypothetical protein
MERKKLKQKLLIFGYSEETIKKMFQLKTRPTLLKAIELQHRFKVPCTAWLDIKSYVNDTKKEEATSSANESNFIPKEEIR